MRAIPDIITHNFDPDRGAFQNLCALSDAEAQRLLDSISTSGSRKIKPSYLRRRRETEQWLLAERLRLFGPPRLKYPIYGFLGDFADGADPSRSASALLPLAAFDSDMLTFTIADSMTSRPLALLEELAIYRKPHHGRAFALDDIRRHVERFGMPDATRCGAPYADRFIEVQIWDDGPIQRLLREGAPVVRHGRPVDGTP